jgi:hypothetical protein
MVYTTSCTAKVMSVFLTQDFYNNTALQRLEKTALDCS